ncbi:siderophore-interacting protein [Sphaerisporangium rubeum]|uniref:NADPH-dependent ferric siderophore reductase n=1 Tax=Sphaerisporangium rubeum TaxID=321317 RepID=A0A7X0IAF6_9ACTN|nr:siderophore-interacting protein [Sphaerisporangium rubeum]MBB6471607.1 NADPH-dependent ferric siderophore reductase [Sphaerisporangium rubeum]
MNVLERLLLSGTVEECEPLTPRMRRVRIAGPALRGLDWVPGQHVRLKVGDVLSTRAVLSGFRDVLRSYSVWRYDPAGALDVCVLDHEAAGPGARWGRQAAAGQRVMLTRPEGRLVLRDGSPYHLFAGDETAAPAFGAMLRTLPEGERVFGAVAVADERPPVPRSGELTWVSRDETPDGPAGVVRELPLPAEPGTAYVAGEAAICRDVLRHLVRERGWPRAAVRVKAFWSPGKKGMD